MSLEEIRMLRWTSLVAREDKIINWYISGSIGVFSIIYKMREKTLENR